MSTTLRWKLLAGSALIALSLSTTPAEAQTVREGTRLRLTTPEARIVGDVRSSTSDSLIVQDADGVERRFAWGDVERVEHSLGRRGHPVRGALIGAGAATALTLGAVAMESSDDAEGWGGLILVLALPVNALAGAGAGAIAGLFWRTERWNALPVGRVSAGPAPGGGMRLAVSF